MEEKETEKEDMVMMKKNDRKTTKEPVTRMEKRRRKMKVGKKKMM